MNNLLNRLATEKAEDDNKRRAAFTAFWLVNAGTSALFGYQYLSALFLPFAALLPIAPTTAAVIAGVLGAAAALTVLDCAYTAWNRIKLHDCETEEQFKWANYAEQASFALSLAFSAIVLMTVSFAHLLSEDLMNALNNIGAVAFVAITIFHLVAWQQWKANSVATREKATQVIIDGQRKSEELAFQKEVNRDAILLAAQLAQADSGVMAALLGEQWGEVMKQRVMGDNYILPAQAPQLPSAATAPLRSHQWAAAPAMDATGGATNPARFQPPSGHATQPVTVNASRDDGRIELATERHEAHKASRTPVPSSAEDGQRLGQVVTDVVADYTRANLDRHAAEQSNTTTT